MVNDIGDFNENITHIIESNHKTDTEENVRISLTFRKVAT